MKTNANKSDIELSTSLRLDDSEKQSNLVTRELETMEVGKESKFQLLLDSANYTALTVRNNPQILLISFICFVLLFGVSLSLILYIASNQSKEELRQAQDLAEETGRWFGKKAVDIMGTALLRLRLIHML